MGKRLFGLLCAVLVTVGMAGCAPFSSAPRTANFLDVFDTTCTVTAYGVSATEFADGEKQLHDFLLSYHRLADIYHSYDGITNLKDLNDRAGGEPLTLDSRLLALLRYGKEAYALSGGKVNIMLGSVLSLWHEPQQNWMDGEPVVLPDEDALREAGRHCAIDSLTVDETSGTAVITDPDARVDVGAVAKGYVTRLAGEFVRKELGWHHVLLNLGGNVLAVGDKNGEPFHVGIQNPDLFSAIAYVDTVELDDSAVVTSGDYQRYFAVDGVKYAHIIDPATLHPATLWSSVTVIGDDCALGDVLSTALFTLTADEGKALLSAYPGVQILWVDTQGNCIRS